MNDVLAIFTQKKVFVYVTLLQKYKSLGEIGYSPIANLMSHSYVCMFLRHTFFLDNWNSNLMGLYQGVIKVVCYLHKKRKKKLTKLPNMVQVKYPQKVWNIL